MRKNDTDNEIQYYICARADNGFIAAYRAYFCIQGIRIRKISGLRYEHTVIFGKHKDDYKLFSPNDYVFNIKASSNDPTEWKIKQNEYQKDRYDIDNLISLLKKTEILLEGYIELILHEFDEYQIIYMSRTDQEGHGTVLGEQSLFFVNKVPIEIGKRIRFISVRDFYRKLK